MPAAEVTFAHQPEVIIYPLQQTVVIKLHLICNQHHGFVILGITPDGIEYFTASVQ